MYRVLDSRLAGYWDPVVQERSATRIPGPGRRATRRTARSSARAARDLSLRRFASRSAAVLAVLVSPILISAQGQPPSVGASAQLNDTSGRLIATATFREATVRQTARTAQSSWADGRRRAQPGHRDGRSRRLQHGRTAGKGR